MKNGLISKAIFMPRRLSEQRGCCAARPNPRPLTWNERGARFSGKQENRQPLTGRGTHFLARARKRLDRMQRTKALPSPLSQPGSKYLDKYFVHDAPLLGEDALDRVPFCVCEDDPVAADPKPEITIERPFELLD